MIAAAECWMPREDSNLDRRYQKPQSYHKTTGHQRRAQYGPAHALSRPLGAPVQVRLPCRISPLASPHNKRGPRAGADARRSGLMRHVAIVGSGPAGYYTAETLQKADRSEEHTSELQSLMRISYAGFSFKK